MPMAMNSFPACPCTTRCRCIERGKPNPVLLPHMVHDEMAGVCDSCNNAALKSSEFGILIKSIQEVGGFPWPGTWVS